MKKLPDKWNVYEDEPLPTVRVFVDGVSVTDVIAYDIPVGSVTKVRRDFNGYPMVCACCGQFKLDNLIGDIQVIEAIK